MHPGNLQDIQDALDLLLTARDREGGDIDQQDSDDIRTAVRSCYALLTRHRYGVGATSDRETT